jgi:chitin synthase
MQQAWREKMALCLIIFIMSCALIGYTVGIGMVICTGVLPSSSAYFMADNSNVPVWREDVTIFGFTYDYQQASQVLRDSGVDLTSDWQGRDISRLFERTSGCEKYPIEKDATCIITNPYFLSPPLFAAPNAACLSRSILSSLPQSGSVYFTWASLKNHGAPPHSLVAFSGRVLNLTDYFRNDTAHSFLLGVPDAEIAIKKGLGKDVTIPFVNSGEYKDAMQCLLNRYTVGSVGTETVGCTFKNIVMTIIITVIWCVILIKLIMAVMYLCISSEALTQRPIDEKGSTGGVVHHKMMDNRLIVLVTCYSEGEKSLRRTLNSIADTDYPDSKKLIFIVSDGLITGSGNNQSTPDVLIRMISLDPNLEVTPKSYIAISEGSRQHNMAAVVSGLFLLLFTLM